VSGVLVALPFVIAFVLNGHLPSGTCLITCLPDESLRDDVSRFTILNGRRDPI